MTIRTVLVSVGLAVGGGVVGSAATLAWAEPRDTTAETPTSEAETDEGDQAKPHASTSDDVERLAARVRSLEKRVSLLTIAIGNARPTGNSDDGLGDGQDAPGTAPAADVADPVFEAAVRDIMDRAGEEREAERQERRTQLRRQIATRWSEELATELQLTDAQKSKVVEIVNAHFEAMRAMRDAPPQERPVTRREWRTKMQQMRQQSESKLREILSPGQYEQYQQLDEGDRLGGGFRGRGGRRR